MADTFACPTCGHRVSEEADACPNCGHVFRRPVPFWQQDCNWSCMIALGILLVIFFVIIWVMYKFTMGGAP